MDVHPPELAELWYFKGFWPISNWAGTERLSEFRVSAILCWHLTVESCPLWDGISSGHKNHSFRPTTFQHLPIAWWFFTSSRPLVALQPMPGSSVVFLTLLSNPHGGNDHPWAYGQLIQGLTIDNMLPNMGIGQTRVAFCLLQHCWDFPGCSYLIFKC
jgi:hypothetical protein